MLFESNKLDKSHDVFSLYKTEQAHKPFWHGYGDVNMKQGFSAFVLLTCFTCIYSGERVKIPHKNIRIGNKKYLWEV